MKVLIEHFRLVKEPKKLAKMKAADLALIASCWYPQAPCAELRILTLLSIWLFLWDDEIDESTGKHIDNFESAQTYRKETLDFTQHSLGLGTLAGVSEISNPIIISFLEIGQHLAKAYSIGTTPRVIFPLQENC
jgi:hypothetical protein